VNSLTLVCPEETLTIPAHQIITKCNLFQSNMSLAELQRFCEGFSFEELSVKLSQFFFEPKDNSSGRLIGSSLAGVGNALLIELFLFIVNGSVIESAVAEAAVRKQLSVDGYTGRFFYE
jgi:hypothetical protein